MNYNLKKLLKDETIPELTNLITEELASYGVCQYIQYQDGTFILNLETQQELTSTQLNAVKNIVLAHNSLDFYKAEKIKEVNSLAEKTILKEYQIHKQINMTRGSKKYTSEQVLEMNTRIDNILDQVKALEDLINSKRALSMLTEIEIRID